MYTIYHIPGIKIGCTKDLKTRSRANRKKYGKDINIETLFEYEENLISVNEIGNIEWEFADHYGYKREAHYSNLVNGINLGNKHSDEQKAKWTEDRKGNTYGFQKGATSIFKDKEHTQESNIQNRNTQNERFPTRTCPYCNKTGKGTAMNRWHGDNCKMKDTNVN